MRGKKIKKEKNGFKKFLIIYIICLVVVMSAFLIYVFDSLVKYEKNQTENFIGSSIQELKKLAQKGKLEKYLDLSQIEKSEFEKTNITIEDVILELLDNSNITYKENKDSKENNPIYDIYVDNNLIFNIELSVDKKENRLGILTFNKWKIEKVTNKMEYAHIIY